MSNEWVNILRAVDAFCGSDLVWFRGLTKSDYRLQASLFRLDYADLPAFLDVEKQLILNYHQMASVIGQKLDGWDLLFSMQHHGVPTRLMDWTSSFSVAVYFATRKRIAGTARVCMLKPTLLNAASGKGSSLRLPEPTTVRGLTELLGSRNLPSYAVLPVHNDSRLLAQRSAFILQGNKMRHIEAEFDQSAVETPWLSSVEIPPTAKEDALRFVRHNDITTLSLFPDLDGLAQEVRDRVIQPSRQRPAN